MIQEVKFQGLTHSPSDYEAQDGELGTCLNLINEDGTLKPIPKPIVIDENITLQEGTSIEFVHKVTHDNEIHSHYIIRMDDNTWYWIESKPTTNKIEPHSLSLNTVDINSICAIGNILCFISDSKIIYAYWDSTKYIIFNSTDFSFSFSMFGNTSTQQKIYTGTMGNEEFLRCFFNVGAGDNYYFTKTHAEGTNALFNSLDTAANKELDNLGIDYFKYTVFGVAAIKLYDGTYIGTSSLFSIGSGDCPNTLNFKTNSGGDGIPTIEGTLSFFKMSAKADVSNNNIYDLIQSVDVFLSEGIPDVVIDKEYKIDQYGDNSYNGQNGTITLNKKNILHYAKAIDNISFYKVLSFEKNDFGNYKDLSRPLKTEETISLSNIQKIYGAKVGFTYNNRLHLADVKTLIAPLYLIKYNEADNSDGKYYESIIVITQKEINKQQSLYINTRFPLRANRVISIPVTNATVTFYIKKDNNTFYRYSPSFTNVEEHNLSISINQNSYIKESDLQKIDKTIWEQIYDSWTKNKENGLSRQQNLIKVSEAENPLVFPAKNSVQVGSSAINALAANTRPISEGQFGEAPLYAFTDEGVWVLMTNGEGTYEARQPANRDICNNPDGILQIDDAVLYPTERGIMMQQGRESICITDALDGYPFNFMDMGYASQIIATNGTPSDGISYVRFREYLKSADMIYDYYDSRIIIFNPGYKYAYVYSLKSKTWSTMESNFNKRINIYPEALAINHNGKIVNVYNKDSTEDVPYFLCSRPIALSNNEIHKTMFSCITRGYFRNEKGKCGMVLYGSNDLFDWFPIKTSIDKYLRGMAGSPYKYFRIAIIGSLSPDESISGISTDFQERWQNKLR